ncbi:S8 family peptidase [Streptomyces xanthii]|nr:S8 family peptidase [Streptomyces xanthii]
MTRAAVRRICVGIVVGVMVGGLTTACGDDEKKADPLRGRQWALDTLRLPDAWKDTEGDDTVIAVVDSGVDLKHPDLKGRLVGGYDFVDGDKKPQDGFGHGTHVAGIAAAHTDNGIGVAGGAPAAKIMPVRVLGADGSGSNGNITRGIVWAADHGADVINLSLGEGPLMSNLLQGGILNAAIQHAHDKGAVVVAAAGNDGAATQPYKVQTPVLVVGASDRDGQPAEFSNFGAQDAVSAPGVGIMSTLPTYGVQLTEKKNGEVNDSGYGELDGTSMAAPYVAAVAALLHGEGKDPDEIMRIIRDTAKNPDHVEKLGLGVVDAKAAADSADD